jgi:Fe-S-cluster containining protein
VLFVKLFKAIVFVVCQKLTKTNKRKLEQNQLMHCSHCGICCEKTEMMLSEADIERLEKLGFSRQTFARYDRYGFVRLKNCHGFCIFYDLEKCNCRIYKHRPLGCRIYPVIYSEQEGVVVDNLCPMKSTVSETELKRKGTKVMGLLQRIEEEAASYKK